MNLSDRENFQNISKDGRDDLRFMAKSCRIRDAVGGRAPRPQSGRQTKGVRLMSSYEICMLILAAVTLVVKLIDMNDHNHKK